MTVRMLVRYGLVLTSVWAASLSGCAESKFKGTSGAVHPTLTKDFTQASYPKAQTSAAQGFSGDPQTEKFEQGEWGALDLLIVIDNSNSMKEEQSNLATKLEPLLSKVSNADWQVAVVTTDVADNCQRALIKKSDADATTKFSDAINAGILGSPKERSVLRAIDGLKCATTLLGPTWVRANSTLVTLIVSDEDNCSDGKDCTGKESDGSLLVDYLSSIRKLGEDAKVYGIFWQPGTVCATGFHEANILDSVVKQTGGKSGSICDADYSTTLTAISEDVRQILKYEFDLGHAPDQGTLKITVDGKAWDKYLLDASKVKFTEAPPFGSKVEVGYSFGKAGDLRSDFPLDKQPVDGSFAVTVDGNPVDASTYNWDKATKRLKFTAAPPEKSAIVVDYKEQTTLGNVFDLGLGIEPSTIEVTVDAVDSEGASYDPATGKLTITPTPTEGVQIHVNYQEHH